MVGNLQAEQATLHEHRMELITENARLKEEVSSLKLRLAEAEKHGSQQRAEEAEFIEHNGALFKRNPGGGGYQRAVFCMGCRMPMVSMMRNTPFYCNRCHAGVQFTDQDLDRIMKALPITSVPLG
jgi:hypothetical protein